MWHEDRVVEEGECGRAWVNVMPANGRVARAIAAYASSGSAPSRDSYRGGITLYPTFEWSYARNVAAAYAYAAAIRRWALAAGEGVRVRVGGRLD